MVSNHKRHDFSDKTKRLLRENVASLCSKPDCRILTVASKSDGFSSSNVGVAAHICAAAPGGPRYKLEQTEAERKHYDNGIWLCNTCSKLIDVDEASYSEALLNNWKNQALVYVRENIGKKLLPAEEVESKALMSTLDYVSGRGSLYSSSTPSKMVGFIDEHLNNLDSRFSVQTNVINGSTFRNITALTNDAGFSISMNQTDGEAFKANLELMRETGKPVKLSDDSFKFTGSKLFETIGNGEGVNKELIIEPKSTKIMVDLYAISPSSQIYLGSFKGKQICLNGGLKFEAYAFSQLIKITYFYNLTDANNPKATCKFIINTSLWNGKSFRRLPFFSKLLMAKDILRNGGELSLGLELEEGQVIGPMLIDESHYSELKFFERFGNLIHIIECYMKIADKYNLSPPVYGDFNLSDEDFNSLSYISSLLEGEEIVLGENIEPFEFNTSLTEYEKFMESRKAGRPNHLRISNVDFLPENFGLELKSLKFERTYFDMDIVATEGDGSVKLNFTPSSNSKSVSTLSFSGD
ncbi:hypothetical protein MSG37_07570 [Shewanella sp. 1CM18E]|uniref:hypothetical protein n=1 Tax=Shewanella sp. 1CM18E TaxID=2929169 RepID=UPI0020BE0B1F|nr:hypothetical protein [Shewanella sp. 1CM18E]MCK8044738.1 hypothetical protein [Shewanella sp. 1CM18E]